MKIRDSVADLAYALSLPEETLLNDARITMFGSRRAAVERHRGLLCYEDGRVEVATSTGAVRFIGAGMEIRAMDRETLLITGRIAAVEYE